MNDGRTEREGRSQGWATLAGVLALVLALSGVARADVAPEPLQEPRPKPRPDIVAPPPDAADADKDQGASPDDAERPAAAGASTDGKAVRLESKRATRLDDGLYVGPVLGAGVEAQLQLTVVNGFIVESFLRRSSAGLMPFDLISVGTANAAGIRLQGTQGIEFVRVSGEILDGERGFGTFDGVLSKVQVSGTWTVTRR